MQNASKQTVVGKKLSKMPVDFRLFSCVAKSDHSLAIWQANCIAVKMTFYV